MTTRRSFFKLALAAIAAPVVAAKAIQNPTPKPCVLDRHPADNELRAVDWGYTIDEWVIKTESDQTVCCCQPAEHSRNKHGITSTYYWCPIHKFGGFQTLKALADAKFMPKL